MVDPYDDPVTDTRRIEIVMDHLVNLTAQVRRLAGVLRDSGIAVPPDVGTLGPASDEATEFLMTESLAAHFPGRPTPWDEVCGTS